MAGQCEITVEGVFNLLDCWRHLPAYQLERCADIIFALFLPEVLQERFDLASAPARSPRPNRFHLRLLALLPTRHLGNVGTPQGIGGIGLARASAALQEAVMRRSIRPSAG